MDFVGNLYRVGLTVFKRPAGLRPKVAPRWIDILGFFSAVSLWVVVRRARVWAGARSSHVAGDVASPARAGSDRTSPGGAKLTTSYSIRSHSSSSDRYDVGGRHCIMPVRSRSGVDVRHRVSIPLGPEIIAGHVACPPQTSRSRL